MSDRPYYVVHCNDSNNSLYESFDRAEAEAYVQELRDLNPGIDQAIEVVEVGSA